MAHATATERAIPTAEPTAPNPLASEAVRGEVTLIIAAILVDEARRPASQGRLARVTVAAWALLATLDGEAPMPSQRPVLDREAVSGG